MSPSLQGLLIYCDRFDEISTKPFLKYWPVILTRWYDRGDKFKFRENPRKMVAIQLYEILDCKKRNAGRVIG
jgi:hypothetical protein